MKGVTHGVMVAGVSSAISAAWIRRQVLNEYDPKVPAKSLRNRLRDRIPLAIAGLGFTGLSAFASQQFDTREMQILADQASGVPVHNQIWNHRKLHSLPYVGGAVIAARLISHAGVEVGHWIAEKLNLQNRAEEIIEALGSIADWVINSLGNGIAGHILGDLPTSNPLYLLKPFSNRNLALYLTKNKDPQLNSYLQAAGWMLTGGAWAFSGLYLLSWEPPETRIRKYLENIAAQDSLSAAVQMIQNDIESLFARIVDRSIETFWNSPLFSQPNSDFFSETKVPPWLGMQFDTQSIWGVNDISSTSLIKNGILPKEIGALLNDDSIYSVEHYDMDAPLSSYVDDTEVGTSLWHVDSNESPLKTIDEVKGTPLRQESDTGSSFRAPEEDTTSLFDK